MKKILLILCILPFFINAQKTLFESFVHDSVNREYIAYIPEIYDESKETPILFVFHGFGGTAFSFYNKKVNYRPIADTAGFIVIYPQGTNINGTTHWNVGSWTAASTADDIGFIDALIDSMIVNFNIDEDRIYACGNSNGGYFSFELACHLNNRIAAIGSNAGTMSVETYNSCNPMHTTAVISLHGTADNTVRYDGTKPFNSKSITDVNKYWLDYNNIDSVPKVFNLPDIDTTDGSSVELQIFENGTNCTSLVHYKIHGGGHGWPGFNGNMDIDARTVIWNFVSQYDMNGLIDCGPTTSNDRLTTKKQIYFSPNPTMDFVTINSNLTQSVNYYLYSMTGEQILAGSLDSDKKSIDLSNLPAGVFLLKANGRMTKIIKVK